MYKSFIHSNLDFFFKFGINFPNSKEWLYYTCTYGLYGNDYRVVTLYILSNFHRNHLGLTEKGHGYNWKI